MKHYLKMSVECAPRTRSRLVLHRFLPSIRREQGLTLIEILIALLVLSIGLIGIAALHLVSLQNASSSFHSSIASSVALDFEERLWIQVARLDEGECISQPDANGIAADLQTLWRGGGLTGRQGETNTPIPAVRINVGTVIAPAGINSQAQVPLTVEWDDERFADGVNTFRHQARVPCYRPPVDDDDDD